MAEDGRMWSAVYRARRLNEAYGSSGKKRAREDAPPSPQGREGQDTSNVTNSTFLFPEDGASLSIPIAECNAGRFLEHGDGFHKVTVPTYIPRDACLPWLVSGRQAYVTEDTVVDVLEARHFLHVKAGTRLTEETDAAVGAVLSSITSANGVSGAMSLLSNARTGAAQEGLRFLMDGVGEEDLGDVASVLTADEERRAS